MMLMYKIIIYQGIWVDMGGLSWICSRSWGRRFFQAYVNFFTQKVFINRLQVIKWFKVPSFISLGNLEVNAD